MATISTMLGLQVDGSFNVPTDRLHDLHANIDRMNRRAKRINQSGLGLTLISNFVKNYKDNRGNACVLPVSNVKITGSVPTVNGWSLIARIEHLDVGNLVSKAPSAYTRELPESYRTCAPTCDHCRQNRARNDTFVLENSVGDVRRVGRNCLADFVRSADIASAVNMFGLISKVQSMILGECDEDHYFSGNGSNRGYTGTLVYLTKVVCAIRLHGWCSRKESNNTGILATADRIADIAMSQTTDMDAQEAELVYDWAQDLCSREQVSDYISNLRTACAQGYVDARSKGLVASAVQAYRNELAFNAAQEAKRGNPSKHVGMVGDKLTFNATVVRCIQKDGMYGMSTIIAMLDDVGNEYTWFASGCHEYKVNQVVKCKGTVKAHNDYQGTKQTILTRCKLTA